MKKEIFENIKRVKETDKLTTKEIKAVVEEAVFKAIQSSKDGMMQTNTIAKEAVKTAVKELKNADTETKEFIDAAVNGTIEGIIKSTKESVNIIEIELIKTKYRLQVQKEILVYYLKNGLDGVNEAASDFTNKIKIDIEDSVGNIKLKNIDILGLMKETVNQSSKIIISEGRDIEEKVAHIVKKAVENALCSEQLDAQKAKNVLQIVILTAIEVAQESQKDIEATTKGAINGAKQGIITIIEKIKIKILKAQDNKVDLMEEEVKQTIEELESIENAFLEALRNVVNKVDNVSKNILETNIKEMKIDALQFKDIVLNTVEVSIDYLKERGVEVVYSTKEKAIKTELMVANEVVGLSERMVKIAKSAFMDVVNSTEK